jgi:hypothetical protein
MQHGAMLGTWKKTRLPHHNRQRKAMQPQNTAYFSNILVAPCKPPHPHKERTKRKRLPATLKQGTKKLLILSA